MAKVWLKPIGNELSTFLPEKLYQAALREMEKREEPIRQARKEVRKGWGDKYEQRVHAKGKMTPYERIEYLKDEDSPWISVGSLVNYGLDFAGRSSPSAGVITTFVKVHGKYVLVIANDNRVASGAWWPRTPEKIIRAQEIALKLRIPVVYLVDCSGLYLPEQSKTFAGQRGAGHIFKMNSLLSAHQVPQIAGVFGDCIAGGGYMPIISDRVYMTDQAYMVIAGAALIKGSKAQKITSLDIGGANIHVHSSACADGRAPTDKEVLDLIKKDIQNLPTSAVPYYRGGIPPLPPAFPSSEIRGILPVDHRMGYPIREIIARLVDGSFFWEILPEVGKEIVVGIGRISGLYVGIIANNQDPTEHPEDPSRKRPGGILYQEGIAKTALFSSLCNEDGIPIIWLQDISGFDVGLEAEKQGLLGYGSNLIYTNSTNQTPMITLLLRKCSGAGYYAMAGLPYDPIVQLATPISRLAVMEGRTLAIGTFHTKLDENFEIVASTEEERREIEKGMKEVERRIEKDMDPLRAARDMDVDEVILLNEVRTYLEAFVEMCYQTTGYRRVKNPRIWSIHNIEALWRRARMGLL